MFSVLSVCLSTSDNMEPLPLSLTQAPFSPQHAHLDPKPVQICSLGETSLSYLLVTGSLEESFHTFERPRSLVAPRLVPSAVLPQNLHIKFCRCSIKLWLLNASVRGRVPSRKRFWTHPIVKSDVSYTKILLFSSRYFSWLGAPSQVLLSV